MATGAFAVVMVVARRGDDKHSLDDYRGLAFARPWLAGLLTLFLLAQAGVPLTGGFVAKLAIFSSAVNVGQYWLALIGMLAAVIGVYVYLRIILTMYAPTDDEIAPEAPRIRVDGGTGLALDDRRVRRSVPRPGAGHRPRLRERRHPTPRQVTLAASLGGQTLLSDARRGGWRAPMRGEVSPSGRSGGG